MIKDIVIPVVLIAFLGLLLEPFGFMPPMAVMGVLGLCVAAFVLFAVFLWKEKGADEREQAHIHKADRFAYVLGALVLVIAIVFQSLAHMLSPWLVIALIAMISAKAAALIYEKRCH